MFLIAKKESVNIVLKRTHSNVRIPFQVAVCQNICRSHLTLTLESGAPPDLRPVALAWSSDHEAKRLLYIMMLISLQFIFHIHGISICMPVRARLLFGSRSLLVDHLS
jgi:hypothetical protein